MRLALELESDRVALGGHVAGRVNVAEGGESRALTLTLGFHEQTRDYSVIPYSADAVLHQGDVKTGDWFDFSFELPADEPPSVKCEHSELFWELAVTSDERGLDTHASRRLEVTAPPLSREGDQSSSRT